ncbi:MAG TPA: hypothetical protein VHV10_14600, partial [Ktedonobacteraceae bacterium]|nr:hypothetical protein [Ktedonobacteraceae bacterium]
TQHECSECRDEDGGCEHLPFKCSNCQGNHPSTSPLCPKRQRVQPTSKTTAALKQTSTFPKQSQPKPSQPNGGRAAPKQKEKTDVKGKGRAVEVVNGDGFETVPPRGRRPRVQNIEKVGDWAGETSRDMDIDSPPVASGSGNTMHARSSSL